MDEQVEVIEETDNKTYRVIIAGAFAVDVADAKSADYAEGIAVTLIKKQVPSFIHGQVSVKVKPDE